jgi:hypothetical protein
VLRSWLDIRFLRLSLPGTTDKQIQSYYKYNENRRSTSILHSYQHSFGGFALVPLRMDNDGSPSRSNNRDAGDNGR